WLSGSAPGSPSSRFAPRERPPPRTFRAAPAPPAPASPRGARPARFRARPRLAKRDAPAEATHGVRRYPWTHAHGVRIGGGAAGGAARGALPRGSGPRDRDLPRRVARQAAFARGRGRRRQDRGGQGPRLAARPRADPPAVLRGNRR